MEWNVIWAVRWGSREWATRKCGRVLQGPLRPTSQQCSILYSPKLILATSTSDLCSVFLVSEIFFIGRWNEFMVKHSLRSAQEVMRLKKCPTKEHAGVKDPWRHSSCVAGACLVHVFRAVYCDALPKKLFCSSYLIASTQTTLWIFFCKLMISVVSLNLARSLKPTTYLSLNPSHILKNNDIFK